MCYIVNMHHNILVFVNMEMWNCCLKQDCQWWDVYYTNSCVPSE